MLLLCLQYPLLLAFLGISVLFLITGSLLPTLGTLKSASFAFWLFFLAGFCLLLFVLGGFVLSIPTEELLFWMLLFLLLLFIFQTLLPLLHIHPVSKLKKEEHSQLKNPSVSCNNTAERRQS